MLRFAKQSGGGKDSQSVTRQNLARGERVKVARASRATLRPREMITSVRQSSLAEGTELGLGVSLLFKKSKFKSKKSKLKFKSQN